jgi:radical SAM superfamily enzyme YgiQ (UPF0313 family)
MKVLLINSPLFKYRNDLYDEDSLPPLGLGYIASQLERDGFEVEVLDTIFLRMPLADIIDYINRNRPDVMASNIFTTNCSLVKELVEAVDYSARIVIGGLSVKELYTNILDWHTANPIDMVIGDGELILTDIIIDQLKEAPFVEQGNRRVFQATGCSAYFVQNIAHAPLARHFLLNEPVKHALGFVEANIVTSRGCIYNCSFCAAARSLNKDTPIREMDAVAISAEIHSIIKEFPKVSSIRVLDDLFLKTRDTVQKAIDVFSGFKLQWRSMAHVQTFNNVSDEMMVELKGSGCVELFIGIESGSPAVLRSIHKTHNLDTITTNMTKLFRAGINVKGYFIYGFPDETAADMDMTFALAKKLKQLAKQYNINFRTSVFQYRPYHATEIYHELQQQGLNLENQQVAPNEALSDLVGRLQFNFHTGNYSKVCDKDLHDYIYRTINLNDGKIFAGLRSKAKSRRLQKV